MDDVIGFFAIGVVFLVLFGHFISFVEKVEAYVTRLWRAR